MVGSVIPSRLSDGAPAGRRSRGLGSNSRAVLCVVGAIIVLCAGARSWAQTGACCTLSGTCWAAAPTACHTAYLGIGVSCTPNPCPPVSGACCNPSGSCTLGTLGQCVGGVYQGNGTSCATTACVQPTGACCTGTGACSVVRRAECQLAGSTYIGDGVACAPGAGGVCPIGACCLPDGTCTAGLSQADCLVWSGVFHGSGTTCVSVACPQPSGACCTATSCAAIPATICAVFNGVWRGPATACTAGGACPAMGVCCRGATCAASITQENCTPLAPGIGALFLVQGVATCNDAGNAASPCCHADFNKSGAVSTQDIFDFLGAWFAGSPFARVGGDGSGVPAVADIFAFLEAWFAGC